jgi:hypothetical protein
MLISCKTISALLRGNQILDVVRHGQPDRPPRPAIPSGRGHLADCGSRLERPTADDCPLLNILLAGIALYCRLLYRSVQWHARSPDGGPKRPPGGAT